MPNTTPNTAPIVLQTNIAKPQLDPAGLHGITGIEKLPHDHIDVFAPGPNYGDGSGVVGDTIGDSRHHGGMHKAVYAYAREELDYWQNRLGKPLASGSFGDNLTTSGVVWADVFIGQQLEIGTAVLEVSVPRTPCATFGAWMAEHGWMKTFTKRGDCGCYFRVIQPGAIRPEDKITFHKAPDHGITMGQAFIAKMGDKAAARKVFDAHVLPGHHHEKLGRILGERGSPVNGAANEI